MITREFKMQVIKTTGQWASGLLHRLKMIEGGGITIYTLPSFAGLIQKTNAIKNPLGLAVDECGQVYFIDGETCWLYLYDRETGRLERISCIGGCGADPGQFRNPLRMLMSDLTLVILDAGNHRIQAFSREQYQIKYIIDTLEEPIDMDLCTEEELFVLDKKSKKIFHFDENGGFLKSFGGEQLLYPISLAVGNENLLYVIDAGSKGFLTFDRGGVFLKILGDFTRIAGDFKPTSISLDKKGNIFVCDENAGRIHQFDPQGDYLGTIQIPGFSEPFLLIACDQSGLYASSRKGIAFFEPEKMFTKEKGLYYAKTLDSGIPECSWHRLALDADIPPRTLLEAYYYASDDEAQKKAVDEVMTDEKKTTKERADFVDHVIPWIGPETNPRDMLFRGKKGRYLWLKLGLSTFDEKLSLSIKRMKVYYPRISYLRYLPAIYQDDMISGELSQVSKEFLERFLSLFESILYDLEIDIDQVFTYFDPDTVPQNFLPWLASWLNMALEEDWPEKKKREFIRQAPALYKLKGTPEGIRRLIGIYTGREPIILEFSRIGKPMVLGKPFSIGVDSILLETPVRGFRLGDDSIIGRTALRDTVQAPEDPFLPMAHRFRILLNLSPEEFTLYQKGISRIVDEAKPAHTSYTLHAVREMRAGIENYVGINTIVGEYQQIRLGVTVIGSGIIMMKGEESGRLERCSVLEKDMKLL